MAQTTSKTKATKESSSAAGSGAKRLDLDQIVSAIATTMFVVDDDLVVRHISDETLKALGYGRDEVVGKMTCADLCRTPLCGSADCTIKK